MATVSRSAVLAAFYFITALNVSAEIQRRVHLWHCPLNLSHISNPAKSCGNASMKGCIRKYVPQTDSSLHDQPTEWEIQRNQKIKAIQGNGNPFVEAYMRLKAWD